MHFLGDDALVHFPGSKVRPSNAVVPLHVAFHLLDKVPGTLNRIMASNTKEEAQVHDIFIDDAADDFGGNAADRADMLRMGKSQGLRVGTCFPHVWWALS